MRVAWLKTAVLKYVLSDKQKGRTMDLAANMAEQSALAADIMKIWDECHDNGEFKSFDLKLLAIAAHRMAELVQAANAFNGKATQ